jgi:predicted nucleic acid-binding protein
MGLIYLDTCLVIYVVENHPDMAHRVRVAMTEQRIENFAVSPLVKLECLVKPLRTDDLALQHRYEAGLSQFLQLALPEPVFIDAARLRARFNLKTADALHLACAQHHGCSALWTNDNRLYQAAHGLAVNVLE